MVRSRAIGNLEPCQGRKAAALRESAGAPRFRLIGVTGR
jgi:hypothetical protein